MTNSLIPLVYLLFLIWIIRNILYLCYLWQLKEYRFDRFFVHLTETTQGKNLLFSFNTIVKWLLILAFPVTAVSGILNNFYPLLVILILASNALRVLLEIKEHILKVPRPTVKSSAIVMLAFIFVFILISFPLTNIFWWLLIIDKFVPLFIGYLIFFFSIPTEFYQDRQIIKAMNKLAKHKKITVIGITGSFGKTSTKEFTAQILGQKFSVIKTKGTNNTPIGIANTILKDLKPDHEILVVEMGAYKRGEIAELCSIVKPQIGILTAINSQHLSLFGSFTNIIKGKYELIEALPKNGIALFNGNNQTVLSLYQKTKKQKHLYYVGEKNDVSADIVAKNVVVKPTFIEFDVLSDGKCIHFKANLLGKHNVENLLPAIFLAIKFGMSERQIQKAVLKIPPLPMTMKPISTKSGAVLIDDTFNANPKALQAALEYLKVYQGRKILVFQPMIELGREAEHEHYIAGKISSQICEYIFLTNRNFAQSFIKGAKESGNHSIVSILTPAEIPGQLVDLIQRKTVVLFEGKEAGVVLKRIEKV